MALVLKDRVKETSTTTGTGTFTLAGAATGFQSFSVIGNSNTVYYAIVLNGANEWEIGIGTYTSSGTTLSRDTVLESSNSGSKVNFSAGAKEVFCTYPAERSVYVGAADNVIYGSESASALSLAGLVTIGAGNSTGNKNYIDNGNFDVWQTGRTASTTTSNNILPDRWQYINDGTNGSAIVFSKQTFTLGQTDVPNNPKYYLNWAYTSVSTPSNYIRQRIEGVNKLQGQQITISAWLKVASGTASCGFGYQQEFGSGGSPSSGYYPSGNSFTVTTTWQRFTYTVTVASISGKTLGTNNNDGINICLFAPVGGASGTLSVSQFQCELGPVATSFDLRPVEDEVARCQRHYFVAGAPGSVTTWTGVVEGTGNPTKHSVSLGQFPVTMRAIPSITFTGVNLFAPATGGATSYTVAANRCSTTSAAVWLEATGTNIAGQACVMYIPSSGYITYDAQL
jgi:hypothetical protein